MLFVPLDPMSGVHFPPVSVSPVKELLSTAKKIIVTTHHRPDGDAMGSSLGMASFLRSMGHHVTVVTPSDYPDFLHWLPGHQDVLVYD
ncbi:MAG: DHH family phosphoesterase, partial [Bacteroidota bacterium]